jgi:hypothetical protein
MKPDNWPNLLDIANIAVILKELLMITAKICILKSLRATLYYESRPCDCDWTKGATA